MPIKGLSERTRIPRLGKIHLGEKVTNAKGVEYPKATEYFVCPLEVQKVCGEKPKALPIMFPIDDSDIIASQFYRCYSQSRGLVCKGDGETCSRLVNEGTGEMVDARTENVVWKDDLECTPDTCDKVAKKYCKPLMCLQFLLPQVPGFGIWQIDTSSVNSILNINSTLRMLKLGKGHIDWIELLLKLEPQEVQADGKKKTVYVLRLDIPGTLLGLAKARNPLQLEPHTMPIPDDVQPEGQYVDAEATETTTEETKPEPPKAEAAKPSPKSEKPAPVPASAPQGQPPKERFLTIFDKGGPDPDNLKNVGELMNLCVKRWKMTSKDVCAEAGVTSHMQIADPMDAYRRIKAVKEPQVTDAAKAKEQEA